MQYVQDNEESYPYEMNMLLHDPYTTYGDTEWQNVIYPYVKSEGVYRCPDDPSAQYDPKDPTHYQTSDGNTVAATSYFFNPCLGIHNTDVPPDQNCFPTSPHVAFHEGDVPSPGAMITFMEGHAGYGGVPAEGVDIHGLTGTPWLGLYVIPNPITLDSACLDGGAHHECYNMPWHAGHQGANIAFADGHLKFYHYLQSSDLQAALPMATSINPGYQVYPDAYSVKYYVWASIDGGCN